MKTAIDSILAFNREYVASKGYEKHLTDKYPDKNAGAVIPSLWDSATGELVEVQ